MTHEAMIELEGLAKLALTEDERAQVIKDFDMLINEFDKLDAVNTDGVSPLIQVTTLKNVFREDKVVKTIPREEILKNAPEQNNGYFQVPKTLD